MLIGICGFKGSGKDTVGDYLVEHYGYSRHKFAERLKRAAQLIFDLSDDQIDGHLKEVMDLRYPMAGLDPRDGAPLERNHQTTHPIDGPSEEELLTWWKAKDGELYPRYLTPRLIMVTLGTEYGRRLYSNVWINGCLVDCANSKAVGKVITDVRFRNEVQAIQDAGGVVVRLLRGELASNHPSEREMSTMEDSEFDFVINNKSNIKYLHQLVEEARKYFKAP